MLLFEKFQTDSKKIKLKQKFKLILGSSLKPKKTIFSTQKNYIVTFNSNREIFLYTKNRLCLCSFDSYQQIAENIKVKQKFKPIFGPSTEPEKKSVFFLLKKIISSHSLQI